MKLRFLHLSNMQFKSQQKNIRGLYNPYLITDALLLHLSKEIESKDGPLDFVLISGDMAHSGKPEEFQVATEFCLRLLDTVKLDSTRLFIVPGNCDLDHKEMDQSLTKIISSVKSEDDILNLFEKSFFDSKIIKKFQYFFEFANKLTNGRLYNENKDYYFSENVQILKNQTPLSLNIIGLNSSLFAGKGNAGNENLILGSPQVTNVLLKKDENALFTIALIHHQLEKISPVDKTAVDLILQNTDILFSGHTPEFSGVIKRDTERAIIVKNGTPPTEQRAPCQFNITCIDPENGRGQVQFYKYLPQFNIWKKDTDTNPMQPDGHFPFIIPALRLSVFATTDWSKNSLYISNVEITNILGFKKLTLNLKKEQQSFNSWIMLLGDNSMGKTSFLRCLALGICDEISTSSLLDKLPPGFIHKGLAEGQIQIDLAAGSGNAFRIITRFQESGTRISHNKEYYSLKNNAIPQRIHFENCPLRDLFICGYGAGRIFGRVTTQNQNYKYSEALGSLFSYSQTMQDPELNLRRIITAARTRAGRENELDVEKEILNKFQQLIAKLFMFDENEYIELTEKGIEVISRDKRELLIAQGDGYKNTAAWILDFLTWNMLVGRPLDPAQLTGIILIDEIEQHLHPRWQRYIIKLLKDQFPGVQFISTTHSPLCAAGTADLEEDEYNLFLFKKTNGETIEAYPLDTLNGMKADQVLTSEAFNLPTTRNFKMADKLTKFSELFLKEKRTTEEEKKFSQLKEYFEENLPEAAEDAESRLLQKKLKKLLKEVESISKER